MQNENNRESSPGRAPADDSAETNGEKLDPTKMVNQPALRTSSGAVWLVMGGFFLIASLVPLGALAFIRQGASAPLATVLMGGIVVLYLAMIGVRVFVKQRIVRLRFMAGCLLAMAATALIGLIVCSFLERTENAPDVVALVPMVMSARGA